MLQRCIAALMLAACCLAFSGCQDSAGAQNTIAPAQLSQQEQEILTLASGTTTAVYDLSCEGTTQLSVDTYRLEGTEWKKQEDSSLLGLFDEENASFHGRLLISFTQQEPFGSCRIAWREDGTVSASDFPVLSFGEGVYYAASAFAQQEREIVPGQPLPLLLLVGNQEGSNTTAAVPSDFYNNPEAIGGDEVQMIAVTLSE